jgi:hypothetical protein
MAQDRDCLETMQRRAVNMLSGSQGVTYEEKLEKMKLLKLEERRHQADMLMAYKNMHKGHGQNLAMCCERVASTGGMQPGAWQTPEY